MKNVCIIGSGPSSLSCGIYLLLNGYNVSIYEKNNIPGGLVTSYKKNNNVIDLCFHWMVGTNNTSNINKIWKTLGVDNKIYNPLCFYKVIYEGMELSLYKDINLLEKELKKYSNNDDELIDELIDTLIGLKDYEFDSYLPFDLEDSKALISNMRILAKYKKFVSMSLEEYANKFNSEIIKYALKNGMVNRNYSSFFFVQTLASFISGNASLPLGGSRSVIDKIINKYLSLNGKLYLGKNVSGIITENNVAKGIIVDDEKIYFDYIVSGIDVHNLSKLNKGIDLKVFDELDNSKEKYPIYSYIIGAYKVLNNKDNDVSRIIKTNEFNILDKLYDYINIRDYGYDKNLLNDKYKTVEVVIYTDELMYDKINNLNIEEYKTLKDNINSIFMEKLKDFYEDVELLEVFTPSSFHKYSGAYKGCFMTYPLVKKEKGTISSNLCNISNLILASQWLMIPGGTCVAITTGKFAASHILKLDDKNYIL